jgi:transcriptional regulator with XRE-family HTH domain
MREFDDDDIASSPYSRKVGERLRVIRRQKRLSLQDVEATSRDEFKASVLGAYERGERAISVPRLERLASFYSVPVDQLLPRDEQTVAADAGTDATNARKMAVDLVKLSQLSGQPFEMLARFLRMIQVQRQDFNGKVLTVRGDDTRAIAAMLDVPVDQVGQRLDALDLLFRPAGS